MDVEQTSGPEQQLAQLRKEERSLSARRTRLHNRIDFLRSGGGGDPALVADQIAELERQEREVSEQRRDVHERIEVAATKLSSSDA